jgi:hypothetical protein
MFGRWNGLVPHFYLDEGAAGGGAGADDEAKKKAADEEAKRKADEEAQAKKAKDFDEWLAKQPDDVKALYADYTAGLKSALDKERKDNKDNAAKLKKLAELEAEEEKRKQAAMSDQEKQAQKLAEAQKKATDAETELQEERVRNAVILEATRQNFADPDDAYTLADLAKLEHDDDGRPTKDSVKAALEELAKAKPYLIKAPIDDKSKKSIGTPGGQKKPASGSNQKPNDQEPKLPVPVF